jgi:4-hydroxy-tetrahydrodipicolinate synthase
MVTSMLNNEMETALKLHYKMLQMNNLIFADGNPAGIKSLMASRGLCKNVLRLPLVPASEIVQNAIEEELKVMCK